MKKISTQSGIATLLLVILVGIAVVAGGIGVSTSLMSKKEASISVSAQTNAELMSWAGVNAFRQYLYETGKVDVDHIINLPATVSLRESGNQSLSIKATNINTLECQEENRTPVAGDPFIDSTCNVYANIISNSSRAKASLTLQTVFKLEIKDGQVINETRSAAAMNLGGAAFSGIKIETDDDQVVPSLTLNIDGDLRIIPGITSFDVSNKIGKLNLNIDGNVYIDCFIQGCNTPDIDITATGWVTLLRGGTYGDIKANGDVKIGSIVEPKNPTADESHSDNDDDDGSTGEDAEDDQKEYVPQYKVDGEGNYILDENGQMIVDTTKPMVEVINNGLRARSITTQQNVVIREAQIAGDVRAGGNVSVLRRGDVVGKVQANGNIVVQAGVVGLNGANANATKIRSSAIAGGTIEVSRGRIEGIAKAGQNVQLRNSNSTILGDVTAGGNVTLWSNPEIHGNVKAKGSVELRFSSTIGKSSGSVSVHANKSVVVRSSSKIWGNVYTAATGDDRYKVIYAGSVYLATGGSIHGNVFALSEIVVVRTLNTSKITGDLYYKGSPGISLGAFAVVTRWWLESDFKSRVLNGSVKKEQSNIEADINDGLKDAYFNINLPDITPVTLDVGIKVDVRVYKDQANYIFNKGVARGASRIYLNHLKNPATGITYMYEFAKDANGIQMGDGRQKAYKNYGEATQTEVSVNAEGFYLGKYDYNGTTYVGAICESVRDFRDIALYKSGTCTSKIVGFLPRVAVDVDFDHTLSTAIGQFLGNIIGIDGTWGLPQAYGYSGQIGGGGLGLWVLRSRLKHSSPQNANLTPGILYFEGSVDFEGDVAFNGSTGNAFNNTILAEGHINAITFSPRIYSPYNILREGNSSLVCNRSLRTVNGSLVSTTELDPNADSDKFLIPTNLCNDDDTFRRDMNLDSDGKKTTIKIGGIDEKKLDLGYVALMSNDVIRIGTCAKIYGDVLAQKRVEGSTAEVEGTIIDMCRGDSGQAVTGQINSQQKSYFLDGSKIIVPNERYSNDQSEDYEVVVGNEDDLLKRIKLLWTKLL